jgi:hypothetical protein
MEEDNVYSSGNNQNANSFVSNETITPICLTNTIPKGEGIRVDSSIALIYFNKDDEEKLLRVFMNDMKKKLIFIEKTNWMFKNNFDIHFLPMYI